MPSGQFGPPQHSSETESGPYTWSTIGPLDGVGQTLYDLPRRKKLFFPVSVINGIREKFEVGHGSGTGRATTRAGKKGRALSRSGPDPFLDAIFMFHPHLAYM